MRGRRSLEWWICMVRLLAVPFAILQVALTDFYPDNDQRYAWLIVAVLGAGALVLLATVGDGSSRRFAVVAMAFDFAIVSAFSLLFAYQLGTPTEQLLLLVVVEGAARFGLLGALAVAAATVPIAAWFEQRRSAYFFVDYQVVYVTFQAGTSFLVALLAGWLVTRFSVERRTADERASEAEALRDELGRRAALLEAANRCARALSSSLDLDEAFGAFIRELRPLVPFYRLAIGLSEQGKVRVIAVSGAAADQVMPAGSLVSFPDSALLEAIESGHAIYRPDLAQSRSNDEVALREIGVRSRIGAPLLAGAETIGGIVISRAEPHAFAPHEIELTALLGRLVGSAVMNLRAYDAERQTVDELRRLSDLRADFVSLVSHELRSPMASVIGAARTLRQRWRDLDHQQRDTLLRVIADETARLTTLVGDVLDTSRIDSGLFRYRFGDVDIGAVVEESVAAASLGQDEVPVVAEVPERLPTVRGDAERLRQVVGNLVDNAVKYSPNGEQVEVRAAADDGVVRVAVNDRGPGVAPADRQLIFEKFGRVAGQSRASGTGLGLYIARSIAEAHGGSLDVEPRPGGGTTFTLTLPVG